MRYPYCLFIGFGKRIEVGMFKQKYKTLIVHHQSDISDRLNNFIASRNRYRGFEIINTIITYSGNFTIVVHYRYYADDEDYQLENSVE